MKFNRGCHDAKLHAQALADLLFGEDAKSCPFLPVGDTTYSGKIKEVEKKGFLNSFYKTYY